MKKNYVILISLTLIFILVAFLSTQLSGFKQLKDPEVLITLGETTIPYKSINYEYKNLIKNQETTLARKTEPEFDITDPTELELELIVSASAKPNELTYRISYNNETIYEGTDAPNLSQLILGTDTTETRQGIYTVEVEWIYDNYDYDNTITLNGKGQSSFKLNINLPSVATLEQTTYNPGDFIKIKTQFATHAETIKINTNLSSKDIEIYEVDGNYEALIPLDYRLASGDYDLNIDYYTSDILTHSEKHTITIADIEFPTQHLTMPESTSSETMTAASNAEYTTVLYPTRALKTSTRYFEDKFIAPTYGIITTDFALTRYTNDNPVPTKHLAIDIAADTGTDVLAFASGKAVVARFLQMTGNTIMIDHGYGLISYYYHLDELNIQEGDMVTQSDLIGKVGTTGYSTGPHLHFAISLNEVYLNPWFFFSFDGFEMDED